MQRVDTSDRLAKNLASSLDTLLSLWVDNSSEKHLLVIRTDDSTMLNAELWRYDYGEELVGLGRGVRLIEAVNSLLLDLEEKYGPWMAGGLMSTGQGGI